MKAAFLCAAALVFLSSAVRAERIQIVGVVANYVTARDAVDIEIWLDRPLNMESEYFVFQGNDLQSSRGIEFRIDNGIRLDPASEFSLMTRRATPHPLGTVWVERQETDGIDYQMYEAIRELSLRHILAFSLDAADVRFHDMLSSPTFAYQVLVTPLTGQDTRREGFSTVDSPHNTATTPEPSTFALLGIAALHLIGLPCLRSRFRKRHVGREC